MKINTMGIFCISLDFELHWGGVEKRTLPEYNEYFLNTRNVIPQMLQCFGEHEVHVTWATVGMLFHENLSSLQDAMPSRKPQYEDARISTYQYISQSDTALSQKGIGPNELEDPFHYAASLIRLILDTPYQELASHTFSHYYCNEPGQTAEDFREDLEAAQASASRLLQQPLLSLVFPRNQFNEEYLKICVEQGIRSVRSNPDSWFWKITRPSDETIFKKLARVSDAFIPLTHTPFALKSIQYQNGLPLCIPASRFLRPFDSRLGVLNKMRIRRIKKEMTEAAQQDQVYHLWWHPHNFGAYPKQSMEDLQDILSHYDHLKKKYGMGSMNMKEITDAVIKNNA